MELLSEFEPEEEVRMLLDSFGGEFEWGWSPSAVGDVGEAEDDDEDEEDSRKMTSWLFRVLGVTVDFEGESDW